MRRAFTLTTTVFLLLLLGCESPPEQKRHRFEAKPKETDSPTLSPFSSDIHAVAMMEEFSSGPLEMHFIKVGQGDSTLITCPNGYTILVDCGATSEANPYRVRKYLRKQIGYPQNKAIDALVISHPDADHYNMIPYVLKDVSVGKVVIVGQKSEYGSLAYWTNSEKRTRRFSDWLDGVDDGRLVVIDGDDIDDDNTPSDLFETRATEVWVLAADAEDTTVGSEKNTRSIVMMVSHGNFDAMLTGDATRDTEIAVMAAFDTGWLDVELLKMGHHGSLSTSTSVQWANTVKAEVCLASAAYRRVYGHPHVGLRERLELHATSAPAHRMLWWDGKFGDRVYLSNYKEAIYNTAVNWDVTVESNGNWYDVTFKNN